MFGAKEGEFSEPKKATDGISFDDMPLPKFENDEDVAEEKAEHAKKAADQEKKIQRALSRSVAERYEKMKREGFNIESIKQYGAEFLARTTALRVKQERDTLLPQEAKELYGAEAELNSAMDKFEDEKKTAEKTIPGLAKSVAEVYARFATDETRGEVRLKKTDGFARDIEQHIKNISAKNNGEFMQFVETIHRHADVAREVAEKEQKLLEEGQLILGVKAKSLPELRQEYRRASKELLSGKGGDDAWWERLQKIIAASKALQDPIREHEEFQKLRKEVVVKYIQGEAKVNEGVIGVVGGYMADYARGKAGKLTLEKQRENLQLLIKQKLMTRDQAQKIYNELEAAANETSARIVAGRKEVPAPPSNINVPRVAAHVREIVGMAVKKAHKTLGGLLQGGIGWLKFGEWR